MAEESGKQCDLFFLVDNCTIEFSEKHPGGFVCIQIFGLTLAFLLCVLPQTVNLVEYWRAYQDLAKYGSWDKFLCTHRVQSHICGILSGLFLMLFFILGLGIRTQNFVGAIFALGLQLSLGYASLNFCLVAISRIQGFLAEERLSDRTVFISSYHFCFILMFFLFAFAAAGNLNPYNFDIFIATISITPLTWLAYMAKVHAYAGLSYVSQANKEASKGANAFFPNSEQIQERIAMERRMRITLYLTWFCLGIAAVFFTVSLALRDRPAIKVLLLIGPAFAGVYANFCSWHLFRIKKAKAETTRREERTLSLALTQVRTDLERSDAAEIDRSFVNSHPVVSI